MKNKERRNLLNMHNYDYLIVGSGFTGGMFAYLAAQDGKRSLILEKREHIAGNMYDEVDKETGILVQLYGPHTFHTTKKEIYDLVRSIGDWEPYTLRARVEIDGKLTPSPFNYRTVDDFFPFEKAQQIKRHLADTFDYEPKVTIPRLLNSEDPVIREYAEFLFEKDYKPYTAKQWGIAPEDLDISVLERVPVRLSYDDKYFDDRYQMMPVGGFTKFFEKMLSNDLIVIRKGVDALAHIRLDEASGDIYFDGEKLDVPVIFTGALDELFDHRLGVLPYRSLSFDYRVFDRPSFGETSGIAYPMAEGYTRTTEFSKLPYQDGFDRTIVAFEYPEVYGSEKGKLPYYPILTEASKALYARYLAFAGRFPGLVPCGRLADFKYYNMDDAVARAVQVYHDVVAREKAALN